MTVGQTVVAILNASGEASARGKTASHVESDLRSLIHGHLTDNDSHIGFTFPLFV
jgi:hypothetical protein